MSYGDPILVISPFVGILPLAALGPSAPASAVGGLLAYSPPSPSYPPTTTIGLPESAAPALFFGVIGVSFSPLTIMPPSLVLVTYGPSVGGATISPSSLTTGGVACKKL